jgi:mannan endo-1,4-beta-mannosidase
MKSEKSWGILSQGLAVLTLTVALAGCGGSSDAGSTNSTAAVSGTGTAAASPTVSGTPATTVAANNRYSFQPTVANPSGSPLSFSIQNKPVWATFGETTGELSGTPAAPDAGQYSNIVITANDGTTTTGLPAFSIQVTPASSTPASASSSSSGSSSSSSGAASVASASSASSASGLTCGGIVWTVVNGVVAKGGVPDASTSQVTSLVCVNNVAYQLSTVPTFGGWYGWIGGKWVLQAGDPRLSSSGSSSSAASVTSVASGSSSSSSGSTTTKSGSSSSSSSSGGTSQVASASSSPTSSPASLLAYLNGLSGQSRHILVGQHSNYWDSNPMDNVSPIPSANGKQVAILGTTNDWTGTDTGFVSNTNAWLAQGGIVLVSQAPTNPLNGAAFATVTQPGSAAYVAWHSFLDQQIAKFKQINGTVLWRPFIELNGSWSWWASNEGSQQSTFQLLWQQTHDYVVSQGVTNVLWLFNINDWDSSGGSAWYPGSAYVDVVSIDAYPPSTTAVDSVYNFLVSTGKPLIFAETGGNSNNSNEAPGSFDNSTILKTIEANFPKAVAVVYWCQNEGLAQQPHRSRRRPPGLPRAITA